MTTKKSTTETGNIRNLNNFQAVITVCTGYGTTYNPSNSSLTIASLKTLYTDAQKAIEAVSIASAQYSSTVADREAAFDSINSLASKIANALKANGATPGAQQTTRSIVRRITGQNSNTKKTTLASGSEPTEKTISTSQLSYDRKLDNLNQLIQTLKTEPNYKPNESTLKIDTLSKLATELATKNNNTITKANALSNARLVRNQKLYAIGGIIPTVAAIKAYTKSIYGSNSPQYKQLSKIQFVSR